MSKFNITAQLQLQAPTNLNAVSKQIKNKLENITSQVDVKVSSKSQKALRDVASDLKKMKKEAKDAKSAMHDLGKATAHAGKRFIAYAAATGVIYKLSGAIRESVGAAIEFERQVFLPLHWWRLRECCLKLV